jgi:hypothetical protein
MYEEDANRVGTDEQITGKAFYLRLVERRPAVVLLRGLMLMSFFTTALGRGLAGSGGDNGGIVRPGGIHRETRVSFRDN